MAKKSKASAEATSTALVPRDPNVELEPWEQALLAKAQEEQETVDGIGGGLRASIKGGKLKINDNPVPGNTLVCVLVAHTASKRFFEGDFDPSGDDKAMPVCYAFGKNFKDPMTPHAEVAKRQAESCDQCPHNEFGSAKTGRGKACKDAINLAFIEAGSMGSNGVFMPYTDLAADLQRLRSNEVVKLSVPATSLKAFKDHIDNMRENFARPSNAMYTQIKVDMSEKDYPTVSFIPLGKLTQQQWAIVEQRSKTVAPELIQAYPKPSTKKDGGNTAPAKGKGKKGGAF